MLVSKANELVGTSTVSFEAAVAAILVRANRTLRGVRAIEVISKSIAVGADGELNYRVRGYLQFAITPPDQLHW